MVGTSNQWVPEMAIDKTLKKPLELPSRNEFSDWENKPVFIDAKFDH